MKINLLLPNNTQQSIFESIGQGDQYFRKWEKEIHPILCEVAMNPEQIQQLFKSVETGAGRSALGKIGDTVKGAADKVSDLWFNKFGGMLQNSTPVQAFDQKYEEIKSSIAAKHPDLAAKLAKYGEFAKEHPNWHKFLLAVAGSVAAAVGVSAAGGMAAGALAVGTGTGVAVGILNIADRLLQGQKASTAIGRGVTTGAIAGLAAGAAAKIGDMVKAGIKSDAIADLKGMRITKHTMDWNGQPFSAVTKEPLTSQLKGAFDALGTSNPSPEAVSNFTKLLSQANDPAYQQMLSQTREAAAAIKLAAKSSMAVVGQLQQIGTAAAGGVASAATNQQPVSESQLQELFGITGNKVDASTLEKAWKAAGSPTDSEQIKQILTKAGVDAGVVDKSFTDMGLPVSAPPAAGAPAAAPKTPAAPTQGAEPPATPAAAQQSKVGVGQINKIIPTLRMRDLQSLQKTVDAALAQRGKTPQPTAEGKYDSFYSNFLGKEI